MVHPEVQALIDLYQFQLLAVEGTLYVETFRSHRELDFGQPVGTAIIGMYCQEPLSHSLFHKLTEDEVWHFYSGDPMRLILLYPDGSSRDVIMGSDILKGHCVQFVVPAGVWQAGHLIEGGRYAVYGTTMAPGFTPQIFERGDSETLRKIYPDRKNDIQKLSITSGKKTIN